MRARATALLTALLTLAAVVMAAHSPRAEAQAAALRTTGQATVSNSKNGTAILSGRVGPGDSLSGTVTIGNVGSASGDLSLALSHMVDFGAPLSNRLRLAVDDVTNGPAVDLYDGPLGSLSPTALGNFGPGASRTYRFTVSWIDGGAADAAYASSSVSVQFDWTATSGDNSGTTTTPPPDTKAPRLTPPQLSLRASKKQRVLKRRFIVARARCDQACTVSVGARLGMRHLRGAVKLRTAHRTLPAGVEMPLKIKLPEAVIRSLRGAVRHRRSPMFELTATAVSSNGASAPVKRNVRVIG
jgi:hypothetical protein